MTTLLSSFSSIYKQSDFLQNYDGLQLATDLENFIFKKIKQLYVDPEEFQHYAEGEYSYSEATVILLEFSDEKLGHNAWFQEKLKVQCEHCLSHTFTTASEFPESCPRCSGELFNSKKTKDNTFFSNIEHVFFPTDYLKKLLKAKYDLSDDSKENNVVPFPINEPNPKQKTDREKNAEQILSEYQEKTQKRILEQIDEDHDYYDSF